MIGFLLKHKKVLGGLVAAATFIVSIHTILNHYERKGYNRAVEEIQQEANEKIAEATKQAIAGHQEKVKKALESQKVIFEAKLEQAKQDRVVETEIKEVIKYVDKIKIDPRCAVVTDDIIVLLNQTIDTANSANN